MLHGTYTFHCRFETDAVLPVFKGSVLRGALGHALRRIVCGLDAQSCRGCRLAAHCLYPRVFEGGGATNRAPRGGLPAPYVIEPPSEDRRHYQTGDPLVFTLLLFGTANDSLPYFIHAFEVAGRCGIGRRIKGIRGRYRLETVENRNSILFEASTGRLSAPVLEPAPVWAPPSKPSGAETMEVRLQTPLRLKRANRLNTQLPFHVLMRAALRRISVLHTAFGQGEPKIDYRGLVHRAEAVKTVADRLRWCDWRRYSSRQDRGMLFGGLVGRVRYEGPLAACRPVLAYAAGLHLGKQTTFGLGRMALLFDIAN